MDLILLHQKNGPKLAKKKKDPWEVKRPYIHLHAYMSVEEFLSFFNRGLRQHFERSNSLFQDDTYHIEDMAYQAEFYAENFAAILSAIDWKEYKNGR
jgi:hypothetical protein